MPVLYYGASLWTSQLAKNDGTGKIGVLHLMKRFEKAARSVPVGYKNNKTQADIGITRKP